MNYCRKIFTDKICIYTLFFRSICDNILLIKNVFVSHIYVLALDVRIALVGGSLASEGRVELTIANITGTVCDDGWDDSAASVICRMVGYR